MKKTINTIIENLTKHGKLNIKTNKKNSLVDFIGVFPELITKAATKTNIQEGFLTTGMVSTTGPCQTTSKRDV